MRFIIQEEKGFPIIRKIHTLKVSNGSLTDNMDGSLTLNMKAISLPPSGKCRVTNIYFDPVTSKLVVEYDDQPI